MGSSTVEERRARMEIDYGAMSLGPCLEVFICFLDGARVKVHDLLVVESEVLGDESLEGRDALRDQAVDWLGLWLAQAASCGSGVPVKVSDAVKGYLAAVGTSIGECQDHASSFAFVFPASISFRPMGGNGISVALVFSPEVVYPLAHIAEEDAEWCDQWRHRAGQLGCALIRI